MYAFLRQFAAASVFDINDIAKNISRPVLIILADQDPIFPIPLVEDYKKVLPWAKMIIYENCGHAIPLEKPDRLSRDIREFLVGL